MRSLVIDPVRSRQAIKCGHGLDITSFSTVVAEQCAKPESLQTPGNALDELAHVEPALPAGTGPHAQWRRLHRRRLPCAASRGGRVEQGLHGLTTSRPMQP